MRVLFGLAVLLLAARASADDEGAAVARAIQALLRAHADDIRACVGSGDRQGEALLDVVAAKDKRVLAARVLKSDPAVATAAACVANKAAAWSLTALPVGEGDQIVVPLVFRPEGKLTAHVVDVKGSLPLATGLQVVLWLEGKGSLDYKRMTPLLPNQVVISTLGGRVVSEMGRALVVSLPYEGPFVGLSQLSFTTLPTYPLPQQGGTVQLGTDGTPLVPVAVDWMEIKAGASVPVHTHDASVEVVYIVAGTGSMTLGAQTLHLQPGQIVQIPKGTPHSLVVETAMTALQIYSPRGPEQRFKGTAK